MSSFEEIERRRKRAKSTYMDVKKHYVREAGWLPVFRRYARERHGGVRYLTLCGKDAIDVRYFRSKGVLPFDKGQRIYGTVTFIEKDAQDYAIIAETLGTTRLGIRGDLEEILVKPEENADDSQRLRDSFPYDIINLDFTGEVVREDDPPYSQTIRAIERIIEFQNAANSQVWHMFLTFRACPQTSNHEADDELRGMMEENLQNAQARAAYGVRPAPGELVRGQYTEFLRIGVAKFLAGSASHRGYACTLEGSYTYPRNPPGNPPYHIVKLIVEFTAIRAAANLPNARRAMVAYERSVPQIFDSQPVDVYAQLANRAVQRRVQNDLQPVLDELREQHIIE
jgi:hypothetical protein